MLVSMTFAGRERKYPDLVPSGVSFCNSFLMDSHLFTKLQIVFILFINFDEKLRPISRPCAKTGSLVVPLYSNALIS